MPPLTSAWTWIKKRPSLVIASIGVLLMFSKSAEPLLEKVWPHHWGAATYFLEHLGAVLVVGMLVRVALEEGYQRAFLVSVNEQVKDEIHKSIDKTSQEALKPLSDAVEQLATGLTYKIIQKLESNLRKVLEDRVLNSPFVRPEYAIHLILRPFGNHDSGILEASLKTSYKVRNQSDKPAKYPVYSWIDDVIRPAGVRESRFTRFFFQEFDPNSAAPPPHPGFDIAALERDGNISEGQGVLQLQYEIPKIAKDSIFDVVIEGKQLMREHDVFSWSVVTLTNKVDLIVELAGGLTQEKLRISPRAIHHAEQQAVIDNKDATKITMKLHQVFLPYQGIEVRWSPLQGSKPEDTSPKLPVTLAPNAPQQPSSQQK